MKLSTFWSFFKLQRHDAESRVNNPYLTRGYAIMLTGVGNLFVYLYNSSIIYGEVVFDYLSPYVDLHYIHWLIWVFYPLVITFLLPLSILLLLYASAFFLHLYRIRHFIKLKDGYSKDEIWDWARRFLAALWYTQGKIWHGHEIIGMEHIPAEGPALLIYYHGAIPIDMYYLVAKCNLVKNRQILAIADNFLFKIPGFKILLDVFGVQSGTVEEGVRLMDQGHILAIAPGGVREAYFSENYSLMWGNRLGFAKIAIQSKVPVIPVFTQNCREAFRSVSLGRAWFRKCYEKTRLPIVPIYGMFPVKMRTYIGQPIMYDSSLSPEQLSNQVRLAVEELILRHQKIPGSILRALMERFPFFSHIKQS